MWLAGKPAPVNPVIAGPRRVPSPVLAVVEHDLEHLQRREGSYSSI
ncbi:hypothetical protein DB30_01443 [Enhygromyxa salina]|uniref:Uncharacterized protein n=1 Tax=Enhygromyxa salina TaxID=215803 RepID=A0A0C2CMG6_9BACT|nr:hypothetical protein DB30_01443 [Enhygromyxa salina]